VGRRLLIPFAAVLALAFAAAAAAAPAKPTSWATAQIKAVTAAGLMDGTSVATFHADDPLTAQALENLAFGLKEYLAAEAEPPAAPAPLPGTTTVDTGTVPTTTTMPTTTTTATVTAPASPKQVASPDRAVTMAQLDTRLVQTLGLAHAAGEFAAGARAAGLKVPSRFGSEVVARLLGLRLNHPANEDTLELRPQDSATRAEAAYSAAQILDFQGSEVQTVQDLADNFVLPGDYSDWQKQILTTAFSKIGMPYIWGGTSDTAETEFGVPSRGGYDCSGFVWRVYKLQTYANEGALASVLRGRTTYVMSAEVPKSKRIGLAKLQPADVIFFGDHGPRSKPTEVGHMGIYVGNGWFVHSSSYGVALAQLDGWYSKEFAWGRRPLAEANLEP
jgi:cell wall-associated NlpC family hydrolase